MYQHGRKMRSCDCSWASQGYGCAEPDASPCWQECCGQRLAALKAARHGTRASGPQRSLCLLVLRWGGWPPWTPLLLRTMQHNPSVNFTLLGDAPPLVHRWPPNVRFHEVSLRTISARVRRRLGVDPPASLKRVDGGGSKISDLKPMLAHLFPERLVGCDFWGWMQEDQLLGNLRAYLDEPTLNEHDTISPLLFPHFHAGPFMVYRNAPHVNAAYRKSSQWRAVVRSSEYVAFDEWWNPRLDARHAHMTAVVQHEAAAGRLKAYTARPHLDAKVWLQDDFVYAVEPPLPAAANSSTHGRRLASARDGSGGGGNAKARDAERDAWAADRWYDESLLMTWRRGRDGIGRLWKGPGSAETRQLWDGRQAQRALLHIMGSKHRTPFRGLAHSSPSFLRLCADTSEFHITSRGVLIRIPTPRRDAAGEGRRVRQYAWFSGAFPKLRLIVRATDVAAALSKLAALKPPRSSAQAARLPRRVGALMPCVVAAESPAGAGKVNEDESRRAVCALAQSGQVCVERSLCVHAPER